MSESSALSHPPQIRADLRPDIVVRVVEQSRPHDDQRNWVIRSVGSYSPGLGRLAVQHARRLVRTLQPRPLLAEVSTANSIRSHCSAINHVIGLLHEYMQGRQVEKSVQVDRAALLVLHAVLLIHLHAKVIGVVHSQGILDLNSDGTADEYTSGESFQAVAKARSLAKAAICQLGQNDQPDTQITCFLRAGSANG